MPLLLTTSNTFLGIFLPFLLAAFFLPLANANIDLNTKTGSKVCIGKICDDSSAFHYYECCGHLLNDCCLKLQTWVIIVLAIIGICLLASFILGLIRCICRCGD